MTTDRKYLSRVFIGKLDPTAFPLGVGAKYEFLGQCPLPSSSRGGWIVTSPRESGIGISERLFI
jgi:hypothetical protein